jgi:histone deacetylase HOS2
MKPARLALAHNLIVGYGLHKRMETYTQRRATEDEMTEFHSEDYVEFLKRFGDFFFSIFLALSGVI